MVAVRISTTIGGDVVAVVQQDHVAGHQLLCGNLLDFSIAEHLDFMGQKLLQRGHGLFGSVLLPEREQGVDDDHAQDGESKRGHAAPRLLPIGNEGESGRDPEDRGEEVCEPVEETHQQRRLLDMFHAVGVKLLEAAFGLRAGQPVRASVEALESLLHTEGKDLHLTRRSPQR
jgi:hypothetical protein